MKIVVSTFLGFVLMVFQRLMVVSLERMVDVQTTEEMAMSSLWLVVLK